MLEFLRIKNVALIEDVEIEFSKGLNVLTGESGAGKSFIFRALDFVLGERMGREIIRHGKDRAFVEAIFFVNNQELLIRREILRDTGRSKIFINDALSSLQKLRELRSRLILYTSQHQQQRLLSPSYHTSILDSSLPEAIFAEKDTLLKKLKEIDEKTRDLKQKVEEVTKQQDFLKFQLKEIERVDPKKGEEDNLYARREELKRQVELSEAIQTLLSLLVAPPMALEDNFLEFLKHIENLSILDKNFAPFLKELSPIKELLFELEKKLKEYSTEIEVVQEMEEIEKRLWELQQLKKKLGRSLEDILSLKNELKDNLSFLERSALDLRDLEREHKEIKLRLYNVLDKITHLRRKKAKEISKFLKQELLQLGFCDDVEISFEFFSKEIYPSVLEQKARLYWRPNPGQDMQPLDKIVSGGELSRVMLALISASAPKELPTIIFDEVDTGIGGITLTKVAQKIKDLAKEHQVILITHWPQLAYLADTHIKIDKIIKGDMTYTRCIVLEHRDRIKEIARMAGGGPEGRALAEELLRYKQ